MQRKVKGEQKNTQKNSADSNVKDEYSLEASEDGEDVTAANNLSVANLREALGSSGCQQHKNQIAGKKTLRIFDKKKADSFLNGFGYLAERTESDRFDDSIVDRNDDVKSEYLL